MSSFHHICINFKSFSHLDLNVGMQSNIPPRCEQKVLLSLLFSCFLCKKIYLKICQVAALEVGMKEGRCGGGEEKQTPYGREKLDFLAHLQDADPERWKVEHWHRSD